MTFDRQHPYNYSPYPQQQQQQQQQQQPPPQQQQQQQQPYSPDQQQPPAYLGAPLPWPSSSGSSYDYAQPAEAAAAAAGSSANVQPKTEPQDPTKQYHPEWGVLRDQDFHPLALKHQRDLENHFQSGTSIADFYFWQANLGGYCMADMNQNIVVSSEGVFVLVRRMVEGAPHPGRKKKKRGMG